MAGAGCGGGVDYAKRRKGSLQWWPALSLDYIRVIQLYPFVHTPNHTPKKYKLTLYKLDFYTLGFKRKVRFFFEGIFLMDF